MFPSRGSENGRIISNTLLHDALTVNLSSNKYALLLETGTKDNNDIPHEDNEDSYTNFKCCCFLQSPSGKFCLSSLACANR